MNTGPQRAEPATDPPDDIPMASLHKLAEAAALRSQALEHVERGAVSAGYAADRDQVLKLPDEALATEIVCVLRTGATASWHVASIARAWVRST